MPRPTRWPAAGACALSANIHADPSYFSPRNLISAASPFTSKVVRKGRDSSAIRSKMQPACSPVASAGKRGRNRLHSLSLEFDGGENAFSGDQFLNGLDSRRRIKNEITQIIEDRSVVIDLCTVEERRPVHHYDIRAGITPCMCRSVEPVRWHSGNDGLSHITGFLTSQENSEAGILTRD